MADDFGIITMAASADAITRACALAQSLRVVGENAPIGLIAVGPHTVPRQFFDFEHRITGPEPFDGDLRFLNKLVHPLQLSPFDRTLFLDDDTIALRPMKPVMDEYFRGRRIAISTQVQPPDTPHTMNHVDARAVADRYNLSSVMNTGGGGHMYFERCEEAREVAGAAIDMALDRETYEALAGQTIVSDEVALLLVANERRLDMPAVPDFVDALSLDQANGIELTVQDDSLTYAWPERPWGTDIQRVALLHFASRGKRSLPYRQAILTLTGLRQSFDRGPKGVARRVKMRIHRYRNRSSRGSATG